MSAIRRFGAMFGVAAACGGVAVAAGGCGAASTIDPVAKAATVSTTSPGYQMRFSFQFSSPQLPTPLTATGIGSIDARDHAGSVALAMNAGNNPELEQVFGGSTLRFQELVKGSVVYLKIPSAFASKLPSHRPWLKLDLTKVSGIPGFGSLANNPVSSDPSQMLGYLRATSGGVTNKGSEVVNGIKTTHYHATISLDKVPNALPAASRKSARQAISSLEQVTHLRQLPVDAWIDSKSLVRRMRLSFGETVPGGVKLNALISIDITKYGPQPVPAFPSADQVTDASSLLRLGG